MVGIYARLRFVSCKPKKVLFLAEDRFLTPHSMSFAYRE